MLSGVAGKAVRFAPEAQWEPQGRARRQEAIAYFLNMSSSMDSEVREQTVQATKPNREFSESFMKKFFHPSDIPFLFPNLMKGNKKQ